MPGVLYISEFVLGRDQDPQTLLRLPGQVSNYQSIEIRHGESESDPFVSGTRIIRLIGTCDFFFDVGPKGQAKASNDANWWPGGLPVELEVRGGMVVSVLED